MRDCYVMEIVSSAPRTTTMPGSTHTPLFTMLLVGRFCLKFSCEREGLSSVTGEWCLSVLGVMWHYSHRYVDNCSFINRLHVLQVQCPPDIVDHCFDTSALLSRGRKLGCKGLVL
jgi:hypothetical protein